MRRTSILKFLRAIVSALVAFAVVFTNGITFSTTIGTHCPTAPVQTILETKMEPGLGSDAAAEIISRKPKLGEAAFVQCHCAEKKAAPLTQAIHAASKDIFDAILDRPVRLSCPQPPRPMATEYLPPTGTPPQASVVPSLRPPRNA